MRQCLKSLNMSRPLLVTKRIQKYLVIAPLKSFYAYFTTRNVLNMLSLVDYIASASNASLFYFLDSVRGGVPEAPLSKQEIHNLLISIVSSLGHGIESTRRLRIHISVVI
jgi:hypothetical protein